MFSHTFDKLSETDSSKVLSPEITSAATLVKPDIAISFRALPVSLAKLLEAIFFTAFVAKGTIFLKIEEKKLPIPSPS